MSDQLPDDAITAAAKVLVDEWQTVQADFMTLEEMAAHIAGKMLEAAAPAMQLSEGVRLRIHNAAYAAGRATERERAAKLADLASRLLSASLFYEPGHPGRPCHRTGWVDDTQLAAWRKELAGLQDGAQ